MGASGSNTPLEVSTLPQTDGHLDTTLKPQIYLLNIIFKTLRALTV